MESALTSMLWVFAQIKTRATLKKQKRGSRRYRTPTRSSMTSMNVPGRPLKLKHIIGGCRPVLLWCQWSLRTAPFQTSLLARIPFSHAVQLLLDANKKGKNGIVHHLFHTHASLAIEGMTYTSGAVRMNMIEAGSMNA